MTHACLGWAPSLDSLSVCIGQDSDFRPTLSVCVAGPVTMCLGSGRAHTALRHVAGQCVQDVTGAVKQELTFLRHRKAKGKGQGKALWGRWVRNHRRRQETCRPRLAVGNRRKNSPSLKRCQEKQVWRNKNKCTSSKAKKHEHNLEQQRAMLADVQLRPETLRDDVKALRALVSETKLLSCHHSRAHGTPGGG